MKVSKIYEFYGEISTSSTKIIVLIDPLCNCYKWFDPHRSCETSDGGIIYNQFV